MIITWRELLIIVAVVLAVYIAELLLLLRSKRGFRRWKPEAEDFQPRIEALEKETGALREQLLMLRQQIDQGSGLHQNESAAVSTPYSQAILLARQGMDAGEVAVNCGISRGEAELIVAMHQGKSP